MLFLGNINLKRLKVNFVYGYKFEKVCKDNKNETQISSVFPLLLFFDEITRLESIRNGSAASGLKQNVRICYASSQR
jgi:hypothetical protein